VYERIGSSGQVLVCAVNFAALPHEGYRIGLPQGGRWDEIINTDAGAYGGSDVGNLGSVMAEDVPWHGRPASAAIRIPPLGALWLRPA
jgi:1,4-alpha-glucan branching enzyme